MPTSPSKVRVAVIGLGVGATHANAYLQIPDAQLQAVCDLNPTRLKPFAHCVGQANCFQDWKQMLRAIKPDLVSIALPNFLHAEVAIAALRNGAHVLCEKPMALTVRQALAMQRAALKYHRKLGLNFSYRFTPTARALKEMAQKGFLGTPYHALTQWTRHDGFPQFGGWFGQKELGGGGPLIDLGVHRIDLAMWLMGSPQPLSVSGVTHQQVGLLRAKAAKLHFDVEDFAAGLVRFAGGESMVLRVSWAGHQGWPELMNTTVIGTHGTLVHRNTDGLYSFAGEYFTDLNGTPQAGSVVESKEDTLSAYEEMVRAIVTDTPPPADAEDGIRVQRILDGLYKSAATGRDVRV